MPVRGGTSRSDVALGVAGLLAVTVTARTLRQFVWRSRRQAGKKQAPKLPDDVDVLRIGYSQKKLPSEIDHIIIGSGLSGLYLACLLSRLGRRVVVLEQHYVAGGCTHTFKDQGFEFDTGVHYVGQATQLTALMDFAAGKDGAFSMQRSGAENGSGVYNKVEIGDHLHSFRPGKENFVGDLVAKFPQEEVAIRRFFREVKLGVLAMLLVSGKQLLPRSVWSALLCLPGPTKWLVKRYVTRPLSSVFDECGLKDEQLRSILGAEFGDYGVVPDQAPFFLHSVILFHYIWEGAFYPVGGSDAFAEVLVPPVLEAGGTVLVRAPVSRIIVENDRAVGVEVKGKDIIRAKHSVISAAGAEVTYRKLLDEVAVEKMGGVPESLTRSEESGGTGHHVYAFIGLEGSSKELGLPTHNIWSFPTAGRKDTPTLSSVWRSVTGDKPPPCLAGDAASASPLPCFMSFPSAKDAGYDARCPGKSTAVVLTEARADFFGRPGPHGKRGAEYDALKAQYKDALLAAFLRQFPELKDKVSYVDVGTPYSNEHYLSRPSSYGLDQDATRFLDPSLNVVPQRLRGLFLTGQDFLSCGVFAQPIVAVMTMSRVLGLGSMDFWLLCSDLVWAVVRKTLFKPLPSHPGAREVLRWLW